MISFGDCGSLPSVALGFYRMQRKAARCHDGPRLLPLGPQAHFIYWEAVSKFIRRNASRALPTPSNTMAGQPVWSHAHFLPLISKAFLICPD